jgi:hypothetical protein
MGLENPRPFLCAPGLRIESESKMTQLQFAQLQAQLAKTESAMERLEKRLWLTVYGVAGAVLTQAVLSILEIAP